MLKVSIRNAGGKVDIGSWSEMTLETCGYRLWSRS